MTPGRGDGCQPPRDSSGSANRLWTLSLPVAMLLAMAVISCVRVRPPFDPPSKGIASELRALAGAGAGDASPAWPHAPEFYDELFAKPLEISTVEAIESGRFGVRRLTVGTSAVSRDVLVKWKPAPPTLGRINNSPRRSVAAHRVQQLLLEPSDYLIPTTAITCVPPDDLRQSDQATRQRLSPPMISGTKCVLGTVSAWLDGLQRPVAKLDLDRFLSDPGYAFHTANLNVLLILIDHSDSHKDNLLESWSGGTRRLFSIDNDIAFGSWFRNPFISDWNRLRVPALPRSTVERLRGLERRDFESLGVVAELRLADNGMYKPTERGANLAPDRGIRMENGVLQFGLTRGQIDGIWRRRALLLRAVDRKNVALF